MISQSLPAVAIAQLRSGGGANAPVNTVLPLLSFSTVNIGDVITCSTGTWSPSADSYVYQWMRGGVNIAGASSSSYTVIGADNASSLTCKVTASRNGIAGSPATSSNSATAFSIASISHLEGWYDVNNASNTVVSGNMQVLLDKTSNARHMNVTDDSYPAYTSSGGSNGLGYLTFSSSVSLRSGDFTAVNPPLYVYIVYAQSSFTDTKQIYNLCASNGFFGQFTTTSGSSLQMHGGSTFNVTTNGNRLNRWQLITSDWDNVNAYLQINNEPYKQGGYGQQGQVGVSETLSRVGFFKTGATMLTNFTVSEMIIVSSSVSSVDDKNIRNFLTQRYNISDNPFAVFFGDSITTGAAADDINAHGYPTLLAQDKGYDYITIAYPGSVAVVDGSNLYPGAAGQNLADAYTRVTNSNTNWTTGYYFFAYGTNDGNKDATWITNYQAIIQTFITAGVPVSHIIMVDAPDGTNSQTATIASNLGVNYFDTHTYFLGYSGGYSALMNVDGLHPNTTGHAYLATGLLTYLP